MGGGGGGLRRAELRNRKQLQNTHIPASTECYTHIPVHSCMVIHKHIQPDTQSHTRGGADC